PLDHGGHGVDALPLRLAGSGADDVARLGSARHSPASLASPRAARRSRRRAASSGTRPGMSASLRGEAVCSWTFAMPPHRSSGPACTSTNCMRPYGTTTSERNRTPLRISRSSSRSAYPIARTWRGTSTATHRPTATSTAGATQTHTTPVMTATTAPATIGGTRPIATEIRRTRTRRGETPCHVTPSGSNGLRRASGSGALMPDILPPSRRAPGGPRVVVVLVGPELAPPLHHEARDDERDGREERE